MKQLVFGKPFVPNVFWNKVLTTNGKHQRSILDSRSRALKWENGRVFDGNDEEMMYLHFHVLKKTMRKINFNSQDKPKFFKIDSREIAMV